MFSKIARAAVGATLSLAVWGAASASNAGIINISATGGTPISLAAGNYLVSFIGTADGGAYDAWNGNCPGGTCTTGWSNAFASGDFPILPGDTLDLFNLGATYSSALASLSAVQSASTITHAQSIVGVPGSFHFLAPIPQPWIVHSDGTPGLLFVPDADMIPTNNFGGVSLRVTAVPEPATWAMLVAGFGLAGATLRRRRTAIAA
jgi:hypothetical protein